MYYLQVEIYTQRYLGDPGFCQLFLEMLDKFSLEPDKVGLFEPLRMEFSRKNFLDLWATESGPEDHRCNMLIGKQKATGARFDTYWSRGSSARLGSIVFWFSKKFSSANRNKIMLLFEDLIVRFDAVYGNVSTWDRVQAQHVTGTLVTRIPGIFWINYFGQEFEKFLGFQNGQLLEDTVVRKFHNGWLVQIDASFDGPNCKEPFEEKVKEALGKDSFGDILQYRLNFETKQIKRVPLLKVQA